MTTSIRGAAKGAYAGAAQGAGRMLTAVHAISETPPPRDRRLRHWLHSLSAVHDVHAMMALDVPWWTYRAVDEVELWLGALPRPARVFEYGSGASSLWLARRSTRVHCVEHHEDFAELMSRELTVVDNATLLVRPATPSSSPAVPSAKEGYTGMDFSTYVASIDEVDGAFDLVVIDGRAREHCLERALARLAPEGVVVFDNSRRRRYRRAIETSGARELRLRGLTPTLPYPEQTSILRVG